MWDLKNLDRAREELRDAVDNYDRKAVDAWCESLIEAIEQNDEVLPLDFAKQTLTLLRRKRFFIQMRKVADSLLQSNQTHPNVRRQYARALIECGDLSAAIGVLEQLSVDCKDVPAELAEARGLIGRALKQNYIDSAPKLTKARKLSLNRAVVVYHEVYQSNPTEYMWHGINAVALAKRAERDGVALDVAVDSYGIATKILATLKARIDDNVGVFDLATAMEASVALGKFQEALDWVRAYIGREQADAFEIGSTLRQLREVWGITHASDYAPLTAALETALLQREGGKVVLRPREVDETNKDQKLQRDSFEKVFGNGDGAVKYQWYKEGVTRARAVGRVEDRFGNPIGSGFLASAKLFFAWADSADIVFVTNRTSSVAWIREH